LGGGDRAVAIGDAEDDLPPPGLRAVGQLQAGDHIGEAVRRVGLAGVDAGIDGRGKVVAVAGNTPHATVTGQL
jgi:hypothetical protein